jgi:hypothetical protein
MSDNMNSGVSFDQMPLTHSQHLKMNYHYIMQARCIESAEEEEEEEEEEEDTIGMPSSFNSSSFINLRTDMSICSPMKFIMNSNF